VDHYPQQGTCGCNQDFTTYTQNPACDYVITQMQLTTTDYLSFWQIHSGLDCTLGLQAYMHSRMLQPRSRSYPAFCYRKVGRAQYIISWVMRGMVKGLVVHGCTGAPNSNKS